METTLQVAFIICRDTLPCSQTLWAFLVRFRKSSPGFSFTDDTLWGAIHLRSECCGSNCVGCYRHDTLVKVQYHNDFNEAQKEAPGLAQGSAKAIADACGRQWVDIFWSMSEDDQRCINRCLKCNWSACFISFQWFLFEATCPDTCYQQLITIEYNARHEFTKAKAPKSAPKVRQAEVPCTCRFEVSLFCVYQTKVQGVQNQKHPKRLVIFGYSWKASGFEFLF